MIGVEQLGNMTAGQMMTSQTEDGSHWVFGYGSLIWRPGFEFVCARPALLRGAHRRLCIYSHNLRGTPERPGLVFGLVRGGACRGMAFQVAAENWPAVWDYLQEREQLNRVYREVMWRVQLDDGVSVPALSFVVDQKHVQYAGELDIAAQFELVSGAQGEMGPNRDYVINTYEHLVRLGIEDPLLVDLAKKLTGLESV